MLPWYHTAAVLRVCAAVKVALRFPPEALRRIAYLTSILLRGR
jgi:hypothetical protein